MSHINPILDTDSYKFSHYLQYPKGMQEMFSYFESRATVCPCLGHDRENEMPFMSL